MCSCSTNGLENANNRCNDGILSRLRCNVKEVILFPLSRTFSSATGSDPGSNANWIGMDLHRSRPVIVRETRWQGNRVQRGGDDVRTPRQWRQTWDAENTSSPVVRWEQVISRISGGNRTVAWNEFIRYLAFASTYLMPCSYSWAWKRFKF